MKSFKGLSPEYIETVDSEHNIFRGVSGSHVLTVRQPRRGDKREHRKAWNLMSDKTLYLYRRKYVPRKVYNSNKRCVIPYYRGTVPGIVPLIMEVDGVIVGFGDMLFYRGDKFPNHKLEPDEVGASMNLCVIDKYQGLGIGSFYTTISTYIAKYFGADYAIGFTLINGVVYKLRERQGWETVSVTPTGYGVIRKRLTPEKSA